jgi:DNA invertase Pin-like site-specific DNA recombinase
MVNKNDRYKSAKHSGRSLQEMRKGASVNRPQLKACLEYLREGDALIVTRLDRPARSVAHLCEIAEILQRKGVDLKAMDQHIDASGATRRLLFNMPGAIGRFETEIRSERQMEGIAKAKLTKAQRQEMRKKRFNGGVD